MAMLEDTPVNRLDQPDWNSPDQNSLTFFKVVDASKAFNQLTFVGNASAVMDEKVDFLASTFIPLSVNFEASKCKLATATVAPSGAVISVKWLLGQISPSLTLTDCETLLHDGDYDYDDDCGGVAAAADDEVKMIDVVMHVMNVDVAGLLLLVIGLWKTMVMGTMIH